MHEERPTPAQDTLAGTVLTPEALRRSATDQTAPTRPGESSPDKASRGSATSKSPNKMRSRLRRCGRGMGFVPWLALLSLVLLVGGITVFVLKSRQAATAATDLLNAVGSPDNTGFPLYMRAYEASVWADVGVAGAAIALLLLAASVRLDQKFRRDGNVYSKHKAQYGTFVFRFFGVLSWLGLILMVLLALWMVVLGVLLSSWAAQSWNLQKGAAAASANIANLDALGSQYTQALDNFAKTVMEATGSNAIVDTPAAVLAPPPSLAPEADPPAASAPTPAPSPTSQPATGNTTLRAASTTPANVSAADIVTKVNATLTIGVAALKQYSSSFTGFNGSLPSKQPNGMCPSAACLDMAMYPFTESDACVCSAASTASLSDLADTATSTAVWALVGVAALFCGAVFGCMELTKDHVMLSADQLFLKVVRRKSRRSSGGGSRSSLKGEESAYRMLAASQGPRSLREAMSSPGMTSPVPSYSMMVRA